MTIGRVTHVHFRPPAASQRPEIAPVPSNRHRSQSHSGEPVQFDLVIAIGVELKLKTNRPSPEYCNKHIRRIYGDTSVRAKAGPEDEPTWAKAILLTCEEHETMLAA